MPLVRVKLNGQSVLMAIDTGARDLMLDELVRARRVKVQRLPAQSRVFWNGTRIAVQNAMVQRLELGGITHRGRARRASLLAAQVEPRA